jgi:hypothetical protein
MKTILVAVAVFATTVAAFSMVGGPIFTVGNQMTAMTVEGSRNTLKTSTPTGSGSQSATMDRVLLTARYGVMSNVDLSASLGTSNLGFTGLYGGYSDYKSSWSFAWGAGVRAGYPLEASPYQVIGAIQYYGFQPKGSTTNGTEIISSEYVWHEVAVSAAGGMRFGPLLPYAGLSKPYLFGNRTVNVTMRGREFTTAGGTHSYSDGQQGLRGILGLEWKLPQGYSLAAEGSTNSDGAWTLTLGFAQVLK